MLSRGSRLCESIIRRSQSRRGAHSCGRPYLARRLGCSTRTVSRYTAELAAAGRLTITPPRRVRTPRGWRSAGVNTYRLPCRPHPAPHVQNPLSVRGDTHVTPHTTCAGRDGTPAPTRRSGSAFDMLRQLLGNDEP